MSEDRDVILNKLSEINERNLSNQNDLLRTLYEIKNKLESADRDRTSLIDNSKTITVFHWPG